MIGQKGVPATYGGIERHVEELAKGLASSGHAVRVYCRRHYTPRGARLPGVKLVRLPSVNTKHLDAITHVALSSWHATFTDADIIHYHALGPSSLVWLPQAFGKRTVVTVHGLDWRRAKWGPVARGFLRLGAWTATHLPAATIVVSKTLRDYFADGGAGRLHYIPNGTPLPAPAPSGPVVARGLEPGRYLLFVGRLVPEKAVEVLLRAHREAVPDWPLVIAGEGHFTDDYVALCRREAGPNVHFTGAVYGAELASLWQHAALVVAPSALEGLSIALLEAMSFGRAVLVSDIPENLEVVAGVGQTFRAGDAADLGERLRELLATPERLAELGRAGRERIERDYSWEGVVRDTVRVYESVLKESRR
jgi:glycosyltransferase involved in cell wall biosynthesis